MKAKKLAGIRLFNYLEDGINWKDHKDVILDFWIKNVSRSMNYNPKSLQGFVTVESLPTAVQKEYEQWFKQYDFQNTKDSKWIGRVRIIVPVFFYNTSIAT